MAGKGGRPQYRPTPAQRERVMRLRADGWSKERIARFLTIDADTLVKHFADELDHGSDIKRAELLDRADKAAKKLNMAAIKWLADQQNAGRAALQLEGRAAPTEEPKAAKLGKKEQQQEAAHAVTGKFAPPAGPTKLH